MGIILTDESGEESKIRLGGIVIGKVEFLPTSAAENTQPSTRQISRAALEKYRLGTEETVRRIAICHAPVVKTVALCVICGTNRRLGHSPMCAACIGRLSRQNQFNKLLDREMTASDFLALCLVCGLLILAVVKFAAPEARHTGTRQPISKAAVSTTARKFQLKF